MGQPLRGVDETIISRDVNTTHRGFHTNCRSLNKQDGDRGTPKSESAKRKIKEREFFFSVLSSSATKRDAKAYLSKFKPYEKPKPNIAEPKPIQRPATVEARQHKEYEGRLNKSGVNLGGLYTYPTAIEESPVFSQEPLPDSFQPSKVEPLHLAIVVLRSPEQYTEEVLDGVALTFAQLARLGLLSVVVIDTRLESNSKRTWLDQVANQSISLASAIGRHSIVGARVVDQALRVSSVDNGVPCSVQVRGTVNVQLDQLLLTPLMSGIIPIVPSMAFTDMAQLQQVPAEDVVLALTRQFAGLNWPLAAEGNIETAIATNIDSESPEGRERASLDRIIVLDPIGGIPAEDRPDKAHIFINLEQEYEGIRSELQNQNKSTGGVPAKRKKEYSMLGASNPFTKFAEDEITPMLQQKDVLEQPPVRYEQPSAAQCHLQNLNLIQHALLLLPPTSSALLTTPAEAASSALSSSPDSQSTGVGTRPKRNPLIHNLLTDKSVISSSLPPARLTRSESPPLPHSTFFKRGMPVTIIPDPLTHPWTPPGPNGTTLDLSSDPRIDFPRLLHLIEDSFGRPLDVHHYLSRIKHRLAGIIIAGEYEGGAILTWEVPPWDPSRPPVPYLDKFAVLRRAQGSGGVADVVFNAMVRNCWPRGVVWRSRRDNPVNRWYFERSVGTWKVSEKWTMFWTGSGVDFGGAEGDGSDGGGGMEEKRNRWRDYVSVCEGVEASWADGKEKPPD